MTFSFASTDLWFLPTPRLITIVQEVLRELDQVAQQDSPRSVVFLSSCAVEGMFCHMKRQLPKPDGVLDTTVLPKVKQDLAEAILIARPFLPEWFIAGFNDFWPFRNYVHALNELDLGQDKPIDNSVAQLGLALLSAYLTAFSSRRFIEKEEWQVITGRPEYHKNPPVLHLPIAERPSHSFLVRIQPPGLNFSLTFKVHIPANGMFNLVYNYESPRSFKMIRLDKRSGYGGVHEGLLSCDDWLHWTPIPPPGFNPAVPVGTLVHEVAIRAAGGSLSFEVDGQIRTRIDGSDWKFDPHLQIGFFNEEVRVTLENFLFHAQKP